MVHRIRTIDAHAAGEPLRLIVDGVGQLFTAIVTRPTEPPPAAAPQMVVAEPFAEAPNIAPPPEFAQPELAATTQTPASDAGSADAVESLPLHWQLGAETRARMPALKLSMHVFAADPAARFVILDGKRRVEGDPIDQGLRVEAIRRDGVVLSYNGQRFLVARAGQ